MKIQVLKTALNSLDIFACAPVVFGQNRQQEQMTDFLGFLTKVDAAQLEVQNGRAVQFKPLWSQKEDVTLSGGFGGTVENRQADSQFTKQAPK